MAEHYMSFTEIAEYLGIQKGSLANYRIPEPDVYIGRTRGWKREKIEAWNAARPGHGGKRKASASDTAENDD
ncbi:transcriptional regulator [Alloscardovia macacae]|uniref:Transcriptional regulator n=1 Tax=Alloscardovia macacae TaxID=1160091 RepID=A0A1Y2SX53_9BIFI|nr:transcriptional regulator [Alloscardovia macacae]OTA26110.1 transcriptional regulator [Alloscardovia macacae]OTA28589.1 transcriptional regulator [Alloscardovia macacae]